LAVPAHYLYEREGDTYVLVRTASQDDGEERLVTTGLRGNDGLVEITSGLNKNEVVLVAKD
ncbi:hypothetical protein KC866_04100, partial [Patescibacteria group bacterium]|nr:hypothetical protein [Patescibacteria group bacterium]